MSLASSVLAVLTVIAMATSAVAGELGKLTLRADSIEALQDRIRLRVPAAARIQPRPHNIMTAPESNQRETRIVIDAGAERMVVMVYELLALTTDDLVASVRAELSRAAAPAGSDVVSLLPRTSSGPAMVAVTAPSPTVSGDAAFLDSVYVALPDGTVVLVAGYVNPEGFKDAAGAGSLLRQILVSTVPGRRALVRSPGMRRLDPNLTVTVPADIVLIPQYGPDFAVYWLEPVRRLGESAAGFLGIYVGGHPQRPEAGVPIEGTLLGRKVKWLSRGNGDRSLETIVPLGEPDRHGHDRLVHAFIRALDESSVNVLRAIAESLTRSP